MIVLTCPDRFWRTSIKKPSSYTWEIFSCLRITSIPLFTFSSWTDGYNVSTDSTVVFVQGSDNVRTSEILHCINKVIMCLPTVTGRTKQGLNCFAGLIRTFMWVYHHRKWKLTSVTLSQFMPSSLPGKWQVSASSQAVLKHVYGPDGVSSRENFILTKSPVQGWGGFK